MIILEGCDGTGKTTLARALLAAFPQLVLRKDPIPKTGLQYYCNTLQQSLNKTLWDRFHLGETVYPIVKQDGRRPLAPHEQYMLELRLLHQGAMLVLCETSYLEIERNFRTRGEHYITARDIPRVSLLFKDLYNSSILPRIIYDYLGDSPDRMMAMYQGLYRQHNLSGPHVYRATGYNHPDVMLVGDRVNPKLKDTRSVAFLHHEGCGPYLAKAMHDNWLNHQTRYHVTNARKTDDLKVDRDILMTEITCRSPRKIIALGAEAHKVLRSLAVPHEETHHPQYWKRFKAGEFYKFINSIR